MCCFFPPHILREKSSYFIHSLSASLREEEEEKERRNEGKTLTMLTTMLKPFSFAKSLVPSLACFACGVLLELGFGLTGKLRRGNVTKKRRLLAVSGTLQDGFALRKNLDGVREEDKAVFIGFALVRGVKMYFDVKPEGCREHVRKDFEDEDEEGRRRQRRPNMNPALVVTNDWNDANVYHVFAVTEEALCEALANEPRYLGIAPDIAKVDLWAKETSESVRVAAGVGSVSGGGGGGVGGENDDDDTRYATMLTVVAYGIPGARAVEAKGYAKEDGCRVTTFAECSARAFGDEKPPFTTRDANIRKAQKGNLASQSPSSSSKDDDEEIHDAINTTKIIRLREDLYGARSSFSPRLIDRTAAERAVAYVQKQRATIPKSDVNTLGGYSPPDA
ncbi:hypothetical protein MICPUN_56735 [Bathycoccus prasinos]|uniref:Uncharacterized protein n=1 Tax=Bathycoccus prasinos TaxID=41875 RepID=K8ERI3_9CHLO|nr:hypothetical protein MICPUN_56735 [Bathycoccus prasinos]CCO15010.1 hypothetical protein MICPUN_56735 [Bathycoccus prasinos]|eukprot:XP_007514770.1 hypothetical protein MICPUN_56735 [Bathycoccus prasinos]